ncbi:Hpt domain-containing protein [Citricoccus sp. SGAir0253]|uniref:Hpt domain-containing protein n=1 Tax=Citricoccus sp. SGAir0253 TaxID=2567881 RepID=UPI001FEDB260|nr:Hpt domain-containing protein [Citricoccus sp. SGAir0253]
MTTAPVLDTDALDRLGAQLDDPAVLSAFIRRYAAMLDHRVERLRHALSHRDRDDWLDAVLSLKSSSAMVGAVGLSELAGALMSSVAPASAAPARWPEASCLEEIVARLRRLAVETAQQLRLFLERRLGQASADR